MPAALPPAASIADHDHDDDGALPPTRLFATEGGTIAYDDTGGSGPLVVAVPGMGDLRCEYRLLRPALAAAGCRVVTLDVRGHGESSTDWADLSARAVGRDVAALIASLGAGPAVVIGTSFAAGAALWASVDAPATVRAAVLLGPIVRDAPPSWFARAAVALGFAGPWRVAFWLAYWNSLFPLRRPPGHATHRAALAANLKEPGRMAALRAMVGLSKADTESMLERVRVPAMVVMGTRDPDFRDAAAEARWLAERLGSAPPLLLDGVGHYPQLEAPRPLVRAIERFLRSLP